MLACRRQRTLRRVCRRWDDLVHSPELLSTVSVRVLQNTEYEAKEWMERLTSLMAWISLRAGQHVQELDLTLLPPSFCPEPAAQLCRSMLVAALLGCADSLLALRLKTGFSFPLDGWVLHLARLRHLAVVPDDIKGMDHSFPLVSLHTLTALQTLEVRRAAP
jgi:hypothetical protein